MTAARATAHKDLVVGLGATGLSIARYLRRSDIDAMFFDSRAEPPGMEELNEVWPDAEVLLGDVKLPAGVARIIASPGISDQHPLLANARKKQLEVVSDIELFAREAKAPFVAITGSNGKSTVTTLILAEISASPRSTSWTIRRRSFTYSNCPAFSCTER